MYLLSEKASDSMDRKYKELTFFCVFKMPGSYTADKNAAIVFKEDTTTHEVCSIFFNTQYFVAGITKFYAGGMALQNNAGSDQVRGFNFFAGIVSWPTLGIFTNLSFEDPVFFAVSFKLKEGDNTRIEGEYDLITSSDFTLFGDDNDFTAWSDNATTCLLYTSPSPRD